MSYSLVTFEKVEQQDRPTSIEINLKSIGITNEFAASKGTELSD